MVSLARANLLHEWRRHLTAIIVLALAGLLMTTQLGLVLGYLNSFSEYPRQLRADVIVRGEARRQGFFSRGIRESREGLLWMHPEVSGVQKYSVFNGQAIWQTEGNNPERVMIHSMDPAENSMTFFRRFPDSLRAILATPGMVVLPRGSARKLGVKAGDTALADGTEVTVGAVVAGLPALFDTNIFTSPQTARLLSAGATRGNSIYLIKLRNPNLKKQVIGELNALLKPARLEAISTEEFSTNTGLLEFISDTFGWILLGSAALGLVVGCGVASQTLRGAFLAKLKEFGCLRAMGVSRKRMAVIAMEQAWWTGIVSIPVAIIIAYGVQSIAAYYDIVIALPPALLMGSSALLLIVALLAGMVSLTAVLRVEPAELLR